MNRVLRIACVVLALLGALSATSCKRKSGSETLWSKETLDVAARLPVQEGGRVKPLSTLADFTLLRINGKRSVKTPDGAKIGATAWMLDVLVRPDVAASYKIFQVRDSAVVRELGLSTEGHDRADRWSYDELRPGVVRLFDLAKRYGAIEANKRKSTEHQIVQLAEAVDMFLAKAQFLDFARVRLPLNADGALARELGATSLSFSELVQRVPDLRALRARIEGTSTVEDMDLAREYTSLLRAGAELARIATTIALQPPDNPREDREAWHTPGELFMTAFSGYVATPIEMDALVALERLGDALRDDMTVDVAAAHHALVALSAATRPLAEARGELRRTDLEVSYYRAKPLYYGLVTFVLAFVLTVIAWLVPRSRALYGAVFTTAGIGTAFVVAAIVVRCIIRGRPPVSTLYETLLFVTAVGAIVGLFIEFVGRRRIALWATAILGMVGLFLANGYETLDAKDTMPSLVAVLDTNFWLATHVTTIVAGYAGGMFAALLGSIYVVMRVLRGRASSPQFFQTLSRMTYGTLCFALILSLVGTILGGIWANDSWGRFWGWDPKENGALLICISQVAILHARLGGYLKELGIAVAAAFGGTVVAFSWFGTNLLGVGLHSYGFTSGLHFALWTYYSIQWGICGLGIVAWARDRAPVPIVRREGERGQPAAASPSAGR